MGEQDRLRIRIDPDKCRGSGRCAEYLMELVILDRDKPTRLIQKGERTQDDWVLEPGEVAIIPREREGSAFAAAKVCPTKAIDIIAGEGGVGDREPRRPLPQSPGSDIAEEVPTEHTLRIDESALARPR